MKPCTQRVALDAYLVADIEFDYCPAEPATYDYPGCPEEICLTGMTVIDTLTGAKYDGAWALELMEDTLLELLEESKGE